MVFQNIKNRFAYDNIEEIGYFTSALKNTIKTNNNELYYKNLFPFASNTFFDKEITNYGIKITDNVIGFIGNQSANKYDSDGKVVESYPILTVLLSDGTTYSVSYASQSIVRAEMLFFTGYNYNYMIYV